MSESTLISTADFQRLSTMLKQTLGIRLPEHKRTMLSSRLHKRMRDLSLESLTAYCNYLFSSEGRKREWQNLFDAVTTNKTDFFREPSHFNFLRERLLPRFTIPGKKHLRVWSAACSTGEEPYTLAMVLGEHQRENPGFSFEILATDICTKALDTARRAVYPHHTVTPVPPHLRHRYLLRGTGKQVNLVRVSPEACAKVSFGRLNFMADDYRLPHRQQVVFCRNVLIYFDRETQEAVINRICRYLEPGGYLFLGHSESIMGYKVPLAQEATTIHRRLPTPP